MTSRASSPILAGAALALILAAPLPLSAQSKVEQKDKSEVPAEMVEPENTAKAARNAGAAGQVIEQLERAQEKIDQDDVRAAKSEMDEAMQMLQKARIIGNEELLLSIRSHLEEAAGALEAKDPEKAGDAIGAARSEMAEVERGAFEQEERQARNPVDPDEQKASTDDEAELTVTREDKTQALPREGDAEQNIRKSERLSPAETRRRLALGEGNIAEPTEMLTMNVEELRDRRVILQEDGEDVGTIGDIVSNGDHLFAIIEHGGFLGIGEDRIAVPLNRLGLRGDDVVLLGLSEEQIEHIPDYDYDSDQALEDEEKIKIGRYE